MRVFISSVQREFTEERVALREYLRGDALLRRFFDVFLFEDVPAADLRADDLYLSEVERCDIYIGLFGNEYGVENATGLSPTHQEFEQASRLNKPRLIFIKGNDDSRHPRMQELIRQAEGQLVRRRFISIPELIAAVYSALVQFLEDRELIRTGPFDAASCKDAALADLDEAKLKDFIRQSRNARGFPLAEDAEPTELLTHLNL